MWDQWGVTAATGRPTERVSMAADCLAQTLISGEQFQLPRLSIVPREERYMIHMVPQGTRAGHRNVGAHIDECRRRRHSTGSRARRQGCRRARFSNWSAQRHRYGLGLTREVGFPFYGRAWRPVGLGAHGGGRGHERRPRFARGRATGPTAKWAPNASCGSQQAAMWRDCPAVSVSTPGGPWTDE
jgi:hypothetical protein